MLGHHSRSSCWGAFSGCTLDHVLSCRYWCRKSRGRGSFSALVSINLHSDSFSGADPPAISRPLAGSSSALKCCPRFLPSWSLAPLSWAQGKLSPCSAHPRPGSQPSKALCSQWTHLSELTFPLHPARQPGHSTPRPPLLSQAPAGLRLGLTL